MFYCIAVACDLARLESIYYAQILYYSILEFFHAIAIITMQILLLCSNYAHYFQN